MLSLTHKVRHIAFITQNFPSRVHPNRGPFVRQLVNAMAELGVRCTVIHPWKLHEWLRERRHDLHDGDGVGDGVQVVRPVTLSLSTRRLGSMNTFLLTYECYRHAVWRVLKRLPSKPDALYGQFLYSGGAVAAWAGQRLRRPGFVAVGEGAFWSVPWVGMQRLKRDFSEISGAVAVSSVIQRRLIEELDFPPGKVVMFPNGVNHRLFYHRDRSTMRKKHGLPADTFLVIYVGNFLESKGVARVAAAINGLPGVAGLFVGSGPLTPRISNVAFCGRVTHDVVPELLSAADCFALPSDIEGSSNVTLEAMACGLPSITSIGEFNDDLVNDQVSIRLDPQNVGGLRKAIMELRDDPVRRALLGQAAIAHCKQFDIRRRAENILGFIAALSSEIGSF